MLRLAWKNILFRKMRTLLTIVGIASSIMLAVLMTSIMISTDRMFADSIGNVGGMIRIQPKSDALKGGSVDTLPSGLVLSKATADEVLATASGYNPDASSPVLYHPLVAASAPNNPPRMVLNGVLPGHEGAVLTGATVGAGAGKLSGERDAIVGASALWQLSETAGKSLTVGDKITLPGVPGEWTIRGLIDQRDAYTDSTVVVPLATAQTALKRGDAVSFVALSYPVDKAEAVAEELQAKLPDVAVVTAGAMLKSINKALDQERMFFRMINGGVYFTAVAIIFMVMYTSVMERTREIGTMRAVGASRFAVVGGLLTEAAIFALIGALIGITATWFLTASWRTNGGFTTLTEFMSAGAQTMGVGLLLALVSTLYPAVRAARINPLEALRYE